MAGAGKPVAILALPGALTEPELMYKCFDDVERRTPLFSSVESLLDHLRVVFAMDALDVELLTDLARADGPIRVEINGTVIDARTKPAVVEQPAPAARTKPVVVEVEQSAPAARPVWYLAHQLGAPTRQGLEANLADAREWLRLVRRAFPNDTFIAPWIASVDAGDDDHDPAQREAGIVDAVALIPRLDGVVLFGSRFSSGMLREARRARLILSLLGVLSSDLPRTPCDSFWTWAVGRSRFATFVDDRSIVDMAGRHWVVSEGSTS